ncbi:nuclear transport factor 2 family protein [Pseudonocardia zijingensis]|jgi:ketosteroid isomerase-like protein|uniref:SnoaL-like domain-containing protein n=1 Tax=Pseudonocardia zijingensis TaxID=153376 RepID=A0ABP4AEY2_9PSEU
MTVANLHEFEALNPFFDVISAGLDGLVDGDHFFDFFAEDAVIEYVVVTPDYPRRIEGRAALAELYRTYRERLYLHGATLLDSHYDRDRSVAVLEYGAHGVAVATGATYENRYISVIGIENRQVVWWRDYLDPLAVLSALGGPGAVAGGADLPPVVATYLQAKADAHTAAGCFAPDAVVHDEGKDHIGVAAIRDWVEGVVAAYDLTRTTRTVRTIGNATLVEVEVAGNFPGSPVVLHHHFTLTDDLITALTICP